ncbi:DUF3052 family protein [Terracidiphilus gabretensis]|uniref:DUF3052 family protein n=1 Tax=Terracidiphilus gabretensis TaxID=1577687 RepID=UPI00071B93FE|nr:DUF3052 family protein [Terracidiphilus gabretensis]
MAGYSGTPLLRKLGIQADHRVLLQNAPANLPEELKDYASTRPRKNLDVVLFFVQSAAELNADLDPLLKAIKADGMIWIAWPKKTSGIKTDLTDILIRDRVLQTPLVDIKVCAIDETWSGLKFVIRKELRAAFAPTAKK